METELPAAIFVIPRSMKYDMLCNASLLDNGFIFIHILFLHS
jgi:hypothetical protein